MEATQVLALTSGGRKEAVARVQVIPGTGTITVNGKPFEVYFPTVPLQTLVREPLAAAGVEGRFDIAVNVSGGGISGQAGAVRHGIARALVEVDESLRAPLRKGGFLTRDSREKERKKYGRKRARKGFQYSKR
ncbi:MAG: 30S ribosomal protein S9 [Armatimonadota bacterium]|nr:30S ribosomal protein S9 [Armatimonadota bacterium]MDR7518862.1 30S ribosomal protein S9 [Armatimonadota bacterium]MDR7549091.1 30S ribosomal protein S9 [Armatimonadota bacterium]